VFRPTAFKRAVFFIVLDIFISFASLHFAYMLRFNFNVPFEFLQHFNNVFIVLTIFKIISLYLFHIYNVAWRFFSLPELKRLFFAHIVAYLLFIIYYYTLASDMMLSRSVLIIDMVLSLMFIGFLRVFKRLLIENTTNTALKKTLIIGANSFAQTIMKEGEQFYIVAILDDVKHLVGSYFSNLKIGDIANLDDILSKEDVESVIIAKEYDKDRLNEIYTILKQHNILDIRVVSFGKDSKRLKTLSVEDLLARHPKDLDTSKIAEFIKDKIILITGAGGSIGSEICRKCAKYGAKKLILLDHSEYNLYSIEDELNDINTVPVMQSVVNKELLDETFQKYKPDIVIHAAAYKHVPLVEANIQEAILNNVVGTKNTIDCAIKYKVEKFVLISTDKAVRPTNVMGTTKRICELYAQNSNTKATEIVAVRFGNVLGSSGSVIPKFQKQIESGGPITVTHPEITRYFMLISEACELVLQAGAIGNGGEIFILDMGEPVKIVDLAKKMCELSGQEDMKIVFCGLRPGEKLYEELLIDDSDVSTQYSSITVAKPTYYDKVELQKDIDELLISNDKIKKLQEMVPEFHHQLNLQGKK